jgi:hypothetical protein
MREIRNILILLFSLFYLFGCGQEKIDSKFEHRVFIELLPKIVDSMFLDIRPIPSLPKEIRKEIRNEKNQKLKLKKWREYRTSYFKNKTQFIIGIEENMESFANIPSTKIDFTKIQNTNKFIFKSRTELPVDIDFRKESLEHNFVGIFSFSRIEIDEKKQKGELWVSYHCGGFCGKGGIVYIKKVDNNWEIEKIEILEVS